MSAGSPDDDAAGRFPRRIDWDRLPGGGQSAARGAPGAPRAGGPAERAPRTGDGRTGSSVRVTGEGRQAGGPRRGEAGRAAAKEAESRLSQPHKRHYLSLWIELPLLLVVAFSAAVLLRTFAVQPFYIPSGSMERTLQEGDKVLVLKLTSNLRTPQRGEVVVFRGTDRWDPEYRPVGGGNALSDFGTAVLDLVGMAEPNEKDFIKRVIAVGGDTVACCDADGNVTINGVSIVEDEYVFDDSPLEAEPGSCHARRFDPVTVPEGHVWVMGDHRGNSQDSRCQGPVPVENIIGRAIALVWPTDRARNLEIPRAFDVLAETRTGDGSALASPALAPGGEFGDGWRMPPALPATGMQNSGPQASVRVAAPARCGRPRRLAP